MCHSDLSYGNRKMQLVVVKTQQKWMELAVSCPHRKNELSYVYLEFGHNFADTCRLFSG